MNENRRRGTTVIIDAVNAKVVDVTGLEFFNCPKCNQKNEVQQRTFEEDEESFCSEEEMEVLPLLRKFENAKLVFICSKCDQVSVLIDEFTKRRNCK